jgi:type IV secretion system protein VirB9
MTRALLLSAFIASTAMPAWALSSPTPGGEDDHVRQVAYDPQNRTALVLQQGMVTNVTFDVMERIERVVLPDENGPVGLLKADKEVNQAPLINNLPLFGASPGSTDMVVITVSPEGKERPYLFALKVVAAPKDGDDAPEASFSLSFTYPIQERAATQAKAQTWKQKAADRAKEIAAARLNTDVFFGQQNWKYLAQGRVRDIVPVEAHDNGRLTAFRYPGNMAHPAVFVVLDGQQGVPAACTTGRSSGDDAPEQAVDTTIVDDLIVVQRTAAHFRIRSGDEVAEIYNCGWNPIGANPGTGTTSPNVVRRVVTQ